MAKIELNNDEAYQIAGLLRGSAEDDMLRAHALDPHRLREKLDPHRLRENVHASYPPNLEMARAWSDQAAVALKLAKRFERSLT